MKHLITSALLLTIATTVSAYDTTLNQRISLLNGRAYMYFPPDARVSTAEGQREWQTQIAIGYGSEHLSFIAVELFKTGDDSLFQKVSGQIDKRLELKHRILHQSDSLLTILSTPTRYFKPGTDSIYNGYMVNHLLVKTKDNTLFMIEAFISEKKYTNREYYIALTENIFKTLVHGEKINNRKARTEDHTIFYTKKKLRFNLPENYCITTDSSNMEWGIHKYVPYEDTSWFNCILGTPIINRWKSKDAGFTPGTGLETEGQFIGKKISWSYYEDRSKGLFYKDAHEMFDHIDDTDECLFEIMIMSNNPAAIDEFTQLIESIRLTKK